MIHSAEGIITSISEEKSGTSASGKPWKRKNIRIEVPNDKFKQTIALQCSGRVLDNMPKLSIGDRIKSNFTIESKPGQTGNDYTDCRVIDIQFA